MKPHRMGNLMVGLCALLVLSCGGRPPARAPFSPYPGFETEDPALQALYWRYLHELSQPDEGDTTAHVPPPQTRVSRSRRAYGEHGHTVYSADECIGPIVAGVCHGSILPKSAYHPTCHGKMLNGQCTGPMF